MSDSTSLKNKSFLILDNDPIHTKSIIKTLYSIGSEIEINTINSIDNNDIEKDFWDMLLVNCDSLAEENNDKLLKILQSVKQKKHIILYSAPLSKKRASVISILHKMGLTNFLAKNILVDPDELLITVQKLIKNDLFGLEKYFLWGAHIESSEIVNSAEKSTAVDFCEKFTTKLGLSPRLSNIFCTVADELITNALYDAPTDENGVFINTVVPRTSNISVSVEAPIKMSVACDGKKIGISVVDPYGSLKKETVFSYLIRCLKKETDQIEQKSSGAGLGLYYIFESVSHFIINIDPQKSTEIIAIFDIRGTFKDFVSKGVSFNMFVDEQS